MKSMEAPKHDKMQRLYEFESNHFETVPSMTDDAIFIEITMFKGRTAETKKLLYKSLVENLNQYLKIQKTDIFIIVHDEPLENWGIRGGKPANEVDLGFKIDV